MAFRIDNFIGSLSKYGTLQTNKFEVEIPVPEFLSYPRDLLILRTERVRLPGIIVDSIENKRYGIGPPQKTATNVRFDTVSMSFIETAKSEIHDLFYDWVRQGVFDFSSIGGSRSLEPNRRVTYMSEYKEKYVKDITIKVFNNSGKGIIDSQISTTPSLQLKLVEAFPISMSDNDLSWGDTNTLYKVNVSFAYSYHQIILE